MELCTVACSSIVLRLGTVLEWLSGCLVYGFDLYVSSDRVNLDITITKVKSMVLNVYNIM
jgi:hypothetical protein